jgi:hypothetical protein
LPVKEVEPGVVVPVIPALRRLEREDLQFQASVGYVARPCFTKIKRK